MGKFLASLASFLIVKEAINLTFLVRFPCKELEKGFAARAGGGGGACNLLGEYFQVTVSGEEGQGRA